MKTIPECTSVLQALLADPTWAALSPSEQLAALVAELGDVVADGLRVPESSRKIVAASASVAIGRSVVRFNAGYAVADALLQSAAAARN